MPHGTGHPGGDGGGGRGDGDELLAWGCRSNGCSLNTALMTELGDPYAAPLEPSLKHSLTCLLVRIVSIPIISIGIKSIWVLTLKFTKMSPQIRLYCTRFLPLCDMELCVIDA